MTKQRSTSGVTYPNSPMSSNPIRIQIKSIAVPTDLSSYVSHFNLSEMLVFDGAFFTTIGRNRSVYMHIVFTDGSYDRRLARTEREY